MIEHVDFFDHIAPGLNIMYAMITGEARRIHQPQLS